jgi:YHS domain-containing protein
MPLLRFVLLIVLAFMFLTVLRGLRIFLAAFLRPGGSSARDGTPAVRDGEMVRDPICGTWIDRRLALPARRGGATVPVCSEKCRAALEALPAPASDSEARAR